jgi:hypothetical protein
LVVIAQWTLPNIILIRDIDMFKRREGKQVFELDQKVGVQDFKNEKLKKFTGF